MPEAAPPIASLSGLRPRPTGEPSSSKRSAVPSTWRVRPICAACKAGLTTATARSPAPQSMPFPCRPTWLAPTMCVWDNVTFNVQLDQSTYSAYDAAGRLTWQVDGTQAVTGFAYDGTGRSVRGDPVRQSHHPGPPLRGVLGQADIAARVTAAVGADRITVLRTTARGDAPSRSTRLGGVTRTVYDASAISLKSSATREPSRRREWPRLTTDAALQGAVAAGTGADRIHALCSTIRPTAKSSPSMRRAARPNPTYDALGQAIRTRQYARAINVAGLNTTASASDIRTRITEDAAYDRVSQQVFNGGGQKIYSVDPLGFVSRPITTAWGRCARPSNKRCPSPRPRPTRAAAVTAAVVVIPRTVQELVARCGRPGAVQRRRHGLHRELDLRRPGQ
jgi:YD repeat-containing protein